jgi:hypothetical protein
LDRAEFSYEAISSPEGDGFIGIILKVRREEQRLVWQEEWRRLNLPRPTRRLAESDAQALAAALLDQADADAAAARGQPSPLPHVTAEQIIERLRAEGFSAIADGLYTYLGQPVRAYYCGFERALKTFPPPKEIPPNATIYWAGYQDGEAAHPTLRDAGVLPLGFGDRHFWRDTPYRPVFERTLLTESDLFADYTVDLMRIELQPVYEPGYPPAEDDIRDTQVRFLYYVKALLHERPLPRSWFRDTNGSPRVPHDEFGRRFSQLRGSNRRGRNEYSVPQQDIGRVVPGQLHLVETYDEPEYDEVSALTAQKRIVGSAVALLEEFRRKEPQAFIDDPVTVSLQRQAAGLRHLAAKGPTQIPEITDEQAAKLGEQGPEAQRSVHDWNESSRLGYEKSIAELPLLEEQIRARGADPYDSGGWTPR